MSQSGPLRVALIGAGGMARKRLPAYARYSGLLKLTAVCDIREEAARELATAAGVETVATDAFRLIRNGPIDAVDICTTNREHAPLAIAAAEAGKHVLVEKPMACTMDECQAMVAAAERAGVTLMVAQNQRYQANHQAVRRAIGDGEIGVVRAVRMDAMLNVLGGAGPEHWVYDVGRAGGGVIMSFALHRIDLARYLVGEIARVGAMLRTVHERFANGAEDWAVVNMEFAGGAVGQLFASFAPFRAPWQESFMIFGDRGTIHATASPGNRNDPAMIASAGRSPEGFVPLPADTTGLAGEDMFASELVHFAECCRSGREPVSSGRDNLGTMRAVFGIYESARRGTMVDLTA